MLGLHFLDVIVLVVYFGVVAYLGIYLGAKKTKTMGDFLLAGGSWGPLVAFLFNFSSALAGAEAVVVSAAAYGTQLGNPPNGMSGIWLWWSMLFATPVYYLFSVIYKRARVFNVAEFFELRFGQGVASLYAVLGVIVCINFIGLFELGAGKVLAAITGLPIDAAVLACCCVVALYVAAGGTMSSLLTDLFQGILCLVFLSFGLLPFLWDAAGGLSALRELPASVWSLESEDFPWTYIVALLFSGAMGSVVAPNIFCWISIGRDEKAGTQCGWAHLWKRIVTIFFAFYGILFAMAAPGLTDPELAWGTIISTLLPVGMLGLLVASFAAALMSSVDTFASTASGLVVDYLYRKRWAAGYTTQFYLRHARIWSFVVVFLGYGTTRFLSNIREYIELVWSLFAYIAVPLYFGLVWRKTNRQALWSGMLTGSLLYLVLHFSAGASFEVTVLVPTLACAAVTWLVSIVTTPEDEVMLNRFYCILSTPIGQEAALVDAGIDLPAMGDGQTAMATTPERTKKEETIDGEKITRLYETYAQDKICGPSSSIEIRKEPGLGWYYRGFISITLGCLALILVVMALSWFMTRLG